MERGTGSSGAAAGSYPAIGVGSTPAPATNSTQARTNTIEFEQCGRSLQGFLAV